MGYSNRWLLGLCQFVKLSTSTFPSTNSLCSYVVVSCFLFGGRFPFWLIFFRWVVQPPSRFFLPSNIHKITNSNFPTLNNAKPQKPIAARHEMSIRGWIDWSFRAGVWGSGFVPRGAVQNPAPSKSPYCGHSWYAEPRFRSKSRMNFGMNLQCLVVSPMRCLSVYWIWKLFVAKETLRPFYVIQMVTWSTCQCGVLCI